MENTLLVLASPAQACPSLAVPQCDWLARWKVSLPSTEPDGTVVLVLDVLDVDEDDVVVVVEEDGMASASLLENSSSNQIRFWESTLRPSWGWEPGLG